ncbi:MAG: hypothetical protein HFG75_05560 [Hungatella sp.]|nr:hypothetical protein [Hungatella sp.]
MKIKFYGTGAGGGIPEIFCNCRVCEYARNHGGKEIRSRTQAVIDGCLGLEFPVDTFAHTAYGRLDMRKVKHILITHAHEDHFMPSQAISRPQGIDEICFYASKESGQGLQQLLERIESQYRSGKRKKTCSYKVSLHTLEPGRTYDINGYQVTPLRARHSEVLNALLYIVRKDGKSVFWGFDTGRFYEEVLDFIKNSKERFDLVVLDCTLKENEQITDTHMDLGWCREMREKLSHMGAVTEDTKVMVSHIGHLVECTHEELCQRAARYGMEVAYDGMEVEI